MKKKSEYKRDVDECDEKIRAILKEYNCQFEVDHDLGGAIILVDNDSKDYVLYD